MIQYPLGVAPAGEEGLMASAIGEGRVLVLCTGNSCRSQMAEGFVNHLLARRWQARSAGTGGSILWR